MNTTAQVTRNILDEVSEWLSRFIVTAQPSDLDVLTLWAVHTHLVAETYTTPRLLLDSPAPGAGKTTTLDHLQRLCFKPVQAASLSSPSLLARLLQNEPRTILIDEADRTLSPKMDGVGELLAVLNSGYRYGASRPVLVPNKEEGWKEREMSTFGSVAMAGNSPDLPDDTRSRCIRVLLLPDSNGEAEDSDWQFIEKEASELHQKIVEWADHVRNDLAVLRPALPLGLRGRNRERWAPLLKIAITAGGQWPEKCRALIEDDLEDQASDRAEGINREPRHIQLLRDIFAVWPEGQDFFGSSDLLTALHHRRPNYWGSQNQYGSLSPQGLGQMLVKHFGIRSDRLTGNRSAGGRGYYLRVFEKTWNSFGIGTPSSLLTGQTGSNRSTGQKLTSLTGSDHIDRLPNRGDQMEEETGSKSHRHRNNCTESANTNEASQTYSHNLRSVILEALSDSHPLGQGAIMRQVKEITGSGTDVPDELDRMKTEGLIAESSPGKFMRRKAA